MERSVEYKGGRLFYTVEGDGETIVLVHGYLESSEVWGEFAENLATDFRVISVDLPGNGKSSLYGDTHTMCFLADAIIRIIDSEKISKVTLVGHSLGGYVSLSIVERFPERLMGYVLFHSHPFADSDEVKRNRIREIDIVLSGKKAIIYPVNIPKMFADSNLDRFSEALEKSKMIASEHEADGIVSVLIGMMNRKARDIVMTHSGVPVMIILGTMDNYIDYGAMVKKVILPPGGQMVTLKGSGHMGFVEECELSTRLVREFAIRVQTQ